MGRAQPGHGHNTVPTQIEHACGHSFTHLVPTEDTRWLELAEALESQPCPPCAVGIVDWSHFALAEADRDSNAGVC